jgi:hypothetical protein
MAKSNIVRQGQRFREVTGLSMSSSRLIWVVERVFIGTDGHEYAALSCASNGTQHKTLSAYILTDTRRFAVLGAEEPGLAPGIG